MVKKLSWDGPYYCTVFLKGPVFFQMRYYLLSLLWKIKHLPLHLFFYFEQFSWVRLKSLANRGKLFAFVFLDQQPLNSHFFKFKVEVLLSSLLSSSIVQTSLFALQSEGTYSEATLQEVTLKYTWSYYLLNKLFWAQWSVLDSVCLLLQFFRKSEANLIVYKTLTY